MVGNDEVQWQADRANLRRLRAENPDWTYAQLAFATNRSLGWVKKWLARFSQTSPSDKVVLASRSRQRICPPPPPNPLIEERVLYWRDNPPPKLKRVPGPRTLSYYLASDPVLAEHHLVAPRSTATIYKILAKNGKIARPHARSHRYIERPAPFTSWQLDYKDCAMVRVGADGKKAHFVEILNIVDVGTSAVVAAQAREDFNAETSLIAVVEMLRERGLPTEVTFDRDPRFVGSYSGRDFPSAFVKFWHVLGVKPKICPPHRPDLNSIVERYHKNLGYECLKPNHPTNLAEVRELLPSYQQFYNFERPHQGRACNNLPPLVANPSLPSLPGLPLVVDPDRWLSRCNGLRFVRKVDSKGTIRVDKHRYYINQELVGKYVMVEVDGLLKQLVVTHARTLEPVKRLSLKGVYNCEMSLAEYLTAITREARSERRLASFRAVAQAV